MSNTNKAEAVIPNNADPAEIAKFNALAAEWWDPQGKFKPLHDLNPLRLAFIEQHCSLAGKTILDVGCGGGILTEALAKTGGELTGIDLAEAVLHAARLHATNQQLNIDYRAISIEALADTQPEHFDVVTCMELLEHVPDPARTIAACAKAVKPGGHLFFSTINRNWKSYFQAILGAEYILKLLPKGTHDYAKFIKPSELISWVRAADLSPRDLKGLSYNIITQTYKLVANVEVNYFVYAIKNS